MKKLYFLIPILFLLASCSDTQTLDHFNCLNEAAAQNCGLIGKPGKGCQKTDRSIKVKVDLSSRTVLFGTRILDDCKVFDKKNWKCGGVTRDSIGITTDIIHMRDGNLYQLFLLGGGGFSSCYL